MKCVKTRIDECIQIQTKLKSLGIFILNPELKEELANKMNIFIKTSEPQTFSLKIPDMRMEFKVILTPSDNKQSGVSQIML
jgi:predicted DNA-binding protein (UPF0278 family)